MNDIHSWNIPSGRAPQLAGEVLGLKMSTNKAIKALEKVNYITITIA